MAPSWRTTELWGYHRRREGSDRKLARVGTRHYGQLPSGNRRRRLRPGGRGCDLGPLRARTACSTLRVELGLRPHRQRRYRIVAVAVGHAFSQRAVFLLGPVFAMLASIAVLSIPAEAIDFDRARDLDRGTDDTA